MKKLNFVLVLLFISLFAFTAVSKADAEFGNVHKGNVQIGAEFRASHEFDPSSYWYVGLLNTTEYFILDRFSLGGTISFSHASYSSAYESFNSIGVGPSATYYFWTQDKWASYLGQAFLYTDTNSSNTFNMVSTTKIGLVYFVTPSVATGPSLHYTHTFVGDENRDSNYLVFMAGFQIHL